MNSQGTFTDSQQSIYEYVITNEGTAVSGPLSISFPPSNTVSLLSPNTIPSLSPSQSYSIYFLITPSNSTINKRDISANSTELINLLVSSEEASLATTMRVITTSATESNVTITVVDEQGKIRYNEYMLTYNSYRKWSVWSTSDGSNILFY